MRNAELKLRHVIREVLINESYSEDEWGALSPRNRWLGSVPDGIITTCSDKPITEIRDTSRACGYDFKPRGLWYAPGREWIDWMRYEMPNWLNNINYVYEVVPSGTVLKLRTPEEVRAFHDKYKSRDGREINWYAVTDDYDGVEIIPYQIELRMSEIGWYYTWDIASGCIWRPSGADKLELIAERPNQ